MIKLASKIKILTIQIYFNHCKTVYFEQSSFLWVNYLFIVNDEGTRIVSTIFVQELSLLTLNKYFPRDKGVVDIFISLFNENFNHYGV